MADYDEWNEALTKYFFKADRAKRRVYLHLSDEDLEVIVREEGLSVVEVRSPEKDLYQAIATHFQDENSGMPFWRRTIRRLRKWTPKDDTTPPFIGLLTFITHIADSAGSLPNFFTQLEESLVELGVKNASRERGGTPVGFDEMDYLWNKLVLWTNIIHRRKLGAFRSTQTPGPWRNVNRVFEQIALRAQDRRTARLMFREQGYEMNIHYTTMAVLQDIQRPAYLSQLHPRTQLRIQDSDNRIFVGNQLLQLLREEGPADTSTTAVGATPSGPRYTLSLCIDEDSYYDCEVGSLHILIQEHTKTAGALPANVTTDFDTDEYHAADSAAGWSLPVSDSGGDLPVKLKQIIKQDASLQIKPEGSVRNSVIDWKKRIAYFFRPAEKANYVQTEALHHSGRFLLLYDEAEPGVGVFLRKCTDVDRREWNGGEWLPDGWKLTQAFRNNKVIPEEIADLIDLSPGHIDEIEITDVALEGGIPLHDRHDLRFHPFAPPHVDMKGAPDLRLYLKDSSDQEAALEELHYNDELRTWHIPPIDDDRVSLTGTSLFVEAQEVVDGDIIMIHESKPFTLEYAAEWQNEGADCPYRDGLGRFRGENNLVRGGEVTIAVADPGPFKDCLGLDDVVTDQESDMDLKEAEAMPDFLDYTRVMGLDWPRGKYWPWDEIWLIRICPQCRQEAPLAPNRPPFDRPSSLPRYCVRCGNESPMREWKIPVTGRLQLGIPDEQKFRWLPHFHRYGRYVDDSDF